MGKGIRWSETQLANYSARHSPPPPPIPIVGLPQREKKSGRIGDVITSIATSIPRGAVRPGKLVTITWPGMKLLTLNELLRIDHRLLHAYKHACHKTVRDSVIALCHRTQGLQFETPVDVVVSRAGVRLVDTDGLYASFKFLIDGFRFAGILRDDDPTCIASMSHIQTKGTPEIGITLTAATENC